MDVRELMSHLMVEHRLDVGKLPGIEKLIEAYEAGENIRELNPALVRELETLHKMQAHHTHTDQDVRIRELEAQVALLDRMAYLRIPIPRLRRGKDA